MFFQSKTPALYLLVPGVLFCLFFVLPTLGSVGISLLDYQQDLYHPAFVGLQNYGALLQLPSFWQAWGHTLVFWLGVLPAMVFLPLLLALLFNVPLKGIALLRALIYLPVVLSVVVVGIAWRWLYASDGLLNAGLKAMGLPAVGWLINPDIALVAVMIMVVWKGLAYYAMMYLAHLQSVSGELYEAARIDGAGSWQQHWYVTLPHLRPTMVMIAIICTIGCLKTFTEIYVLTHGGPVGATQTMVYWIYHEAFERLNLGQASAAGLVLMLVLMVLSAVQLKLNTRPLT